MSHKYTLIEILLISNMKSILLYDSYFNNSKGGGGSGVIPSHTRSVNVKHTTGPIKIYIQNFDITNLSYRGRYVKLHLCFQLLPARKKPLFRLTKYYNHSSFGKFFQNAGQYR